MFLVDLHSGVVRTEEGSAGCLLLSGAMLTVSTHMLHRQVKQGAHVNFHFPTSVRPSRNEIQL